MIVDPGGSTGGSSKSGAGAVAGVGAGAKQKAIKKPVLSSPRVSPSYTPGPVSSVRPQSTVADYQSRLDAYNKSRKGFLDGINKGVASSNKAYADLMNKYKGDLEGGKKAATDLYNQNYKGLTDKRSTDLTGIGQDYSSRGIGQSSGIYQQALKDYETNYGNSVKDAKTSLDNATGSATKSYQTNTTAAAKRRSAALAQAKTKTSAYDKSHPKPKA